jgi:hypothetical protein
VFVLSLVILAAGASHSAPTAPPDHGIALVELFTSEGCSSCPPADALLERLATDAATSGRHIYCLSFHVDYWDHLGWKDRFSSAAFTERQGEYAKRLGATSLYTPEMVVNGTDEFVGSDRNAAESAIRDALSRSEEASLKLEATAKGHDVSARCQVAHLPAGAVVNVAWVDAHATSKPSGGENDGRALRHVNVVRDLRSMGLAPGVVGRLSLRRPELSDGAVIAWVQASGSGRVLAAQSVRITAH